ncbi:MAG: hypothetical protein EBS06_05545 [Proteobacteria bacterium]|nr:hypothetical protein [Pseudomonadota bacterium]
MPNFTFQIKNCKIFAYGSKQGKGWGKLVWTDGTEPFEQGFQTNSQLVMDTIDANRSAEAEFKVSGTMTLNQGYGDHKGKVFKNYVLTEIEVL